MPATLVEARNEESPKRPAREDRTKATKREEATPHLKFGDRFSFTVLDEDEVSNLGGETRDDTDHEGTDKDKESQEQMFRS